MTGAAGGHGLGMGPSVDGEVAYGMAAFHGTPYSGFYLGQAGTRAFSSGVRYELGAGVGPRLEGTRRESTFGAPQHTVGSAGGCGSGRAEGCGSDRRAPPSGSPGGVLRTRSGLIGDLLDAGRVLVSQRRRSGTSGMPRLKSTSRRWASDAPNAPIAAVSGSRSIART